MRGALPFIRFLFFLAMALVLPKPIQAQGGALDAYIREAFANSPTLREKQFQTERSLLALEEAKRLFYPNVGLNGTYTLAAGGRRLEFPIGDLLNPVYSTLNELTKTNNFPQVENVNELLAPNNFYDVKVRTQQPIINAEIRLNRKIKAAQASLPEMEAQVIKRELAKDVKVAYFQYMQASEAIRIYEQALQLLAESKRVNESLLRNDKALPSALSRVNGEIAEVEANAVKARNAQRNAAAYFNHLLGRTLDSPILADSSALQAPILALQAAPREELAQLNKAKELGQLLVNVEETYRKPKLGAQLDLGSQAFNFRWGGYALLGLNFELPLWSAKRDQLQVQQAKMGLNVIDQQIKQAEDQILLQIQVARNNLEAEQNAFNSFEAQQNAARQYYRDIFRRYREGQANALELFDARNRMTNVELQRSIAQYSILARAAELERALAAFSL
jgi:outer membrane protein